MLEILIDKYGVFGTLSDKDIFEIYKKNGKVPKTSKFEECSIIRVENNKECVGKCL